MPVPAWIRSEAGTVRFVNRAFEKSFKLRGSRIVGTPERSLWPPGVAGQLDGAGREGRVEFPSGPRLVHTFALPGSRS